MTDPLHFWPVNKWKESQDAFKSDWPRSIPGYTVLEHQREWLEQGLEYGFKVYVPYGDVWNGIIGVNEKSTSYEIVIQCPRNDTTKLADALKTTKLIDWNKPIVLPFVPTHIAQCVQTLFDDLNMELETHIPSQSFYMEKDRPLFEDVSLPPGVTLDILTRDHLDIVDQHWPHRYPGSDWYFDLLIKSKSGYGLFLNGELISWMFNNEFGILTHVFTLEEHRKKGYSEILLKLVCNKLLKEHKNIYAFCVADNKCASNLYNKVGFSNYNQFGFGWYWLRRKIE
ncbi:uncharacterized protein LOC128677581 [Plodia interpunctella]|uniref:uncharacterized protein LOC128677581 n=1 Tax=Plodia interpunctella TaxID=58824 RepID=UPI00236775FE|nr:uncharacterized protein LOC128677581 [Plodia interpunctella]XP_053614506.1 uncharacterized protein LOC128677581 [Plodia interpunctella]